MGRKFLDRLLLAAFVAGVALALTSSPSPAQAGRNVAPSKAALNLSASLPPGMFPASVPCASVGPDGTPYVRGVNCRVMEVDGYPRWFYVYVPFTSKFKLKQKTPVVFGFHGSGGSGEGFAGNSGWVEKAEEEGFVAVFGSGLAYVALDGGLEKHWNRYTLEDEVNVNIRTNGYPPAPAPWPADDIKFVRQMLADLSSMLRVDERKVYATGFSNGAGFTGRVAVELSDLFAAAAGSGGGLHEAHTDAVRRIPLFITIGDRDGNFLRFLNDAESLDPPLTRLPLTYADFVSHPTGERFINAHLDSLGLSHSPTEISELPDRMELLYTTQTGDVPPGRGFFRFAVLQGFGHVYPGAAENPHGFDAPDMFWDFFSRPKP